VGPPSFARLRFCFNRRSVCPTNVLKGAKETLERMGDLMWALDTRSYSQVRSIISNLRAIIRDNIDRKNYLQIRTFAALRAMRSVFCGISVRMQAARVTMQRLRIRLRRARGYGGGDYGVLSVILAGRGQVYQKFYQS
jgi:hypothetical protein